MAMEIPRGLLLVEIEGEKKGLLKGENPCIFCPRRLRGRKSEHIQRCKRRKILPEKEKEKRLFLALGEKGNILHPGKGSGEANLFGVNKGGEAHEGITWGGKKVEKHSDW